MTDWGVSMTHHKGQKPSLSITREVCVCLYNQGGLSPCCPRLRLCLYVHSHTSRAPTERDKITGVPPYLPFFLWFQLPVVNRRPNILNRKLQKSTIHELEVACLSE